VETPTSNTNTSSLQEVTSSLDYHATRDERLLTVLYKQVEEVKKELHDLKTKKILDETQLPSELLEQSGLLPKLHRKLKRGRGFRPLLSSEIIEAKKHSKFGSQQARYMGVCLRTYIKYARMYGLWEPRPNEKGKKQPHDPESGKYPLSRILNGDFNNNSYVVDFRVKPKLIRANLPEFPECCAQCGFHEKMITTGKVPLLIDHLDGDRRN
jgi:hypothetical protein